MLTFLLSPIWEVLKSGDLLETEPVVQNHLKARRGWFILSNVNKVDSHLNEIPGVVSGILSRYVLDIFDWKTNLHTEVGFHCIYL